MAYGSFLDMEQMEKEPGGVDGDTGWRYEYWHVGMVRNAKEKRRMKVYLDPIPHTVLDQSANMRGWYKDKHTPPGVRPRPCYTEAILTQPYGGACPVRCTFCYVNNGVRGYRGQGLTTVDPNYPLKMEKMLSRMRTGAAFYISSFTEPFQIVEDHYHNTQRTAQVAVDAGLPVFFLTRQVVPGWAIDQLKRNRYSYQQFSINTPSDKDWRIFSPRAATLAQLLHSVKEVSSQGVYVSIQCNPIMAGVTTLDELKQLVWLLSESGANHVIFKFVEIVSPAVAAMVAKAKRLFKKRGDVFEGLFNETIGGVRTIAEEVRLAWLTELKKETKKAKMTMGLCYEYGYARTPEGKVINKTGESLGPRFTTAAQCHGKRVPIFTREDTTEKFKPFKGCPPSGCLYCVSERGAVPPCGNVKLGEARALVYKDYQFPAVVTREDSDK